MPAPGGLCESCGSPLQWTVPHRQVGGLLVRCKNCPDLFEESGTEVAERELREGHGAEMPDGRPIRSIEEIVQDAFQLSFCLEGGRYV